MKSLAGGRGLDWVTRTEPLGQGEAESLGRFESERVELVGQLAWVLVDILMSGWGIPGDVANGVLKIDVSNREAAIGINPHGDDGLAARSGKQQRSLEHLD